LVFNVRYMANFLYLKPNIRHIANIKHSEIGKLWLLEEKSERKFVLPEKI
jgi:hypothetical protein